jgi:signal peptidase II
VAPKYKLFLLAFLLSVGLDQGTKIWVRQVLRPRAPDVITIVPGYFELEYAENTGVAFSLMRDRPEMRPLLFVFGLVALTMIVIYLRRGPAGHWRLGLELGLVMGGAVGNLIDRMAFGHVTDFVLWRIGTHRWPNFNVADAALLVGVVGLVFDLKPTEKSNKPASSQRS